MGDAATPATPPAAPSILNVTNQYGEYWKTSALSFNILYFLSLIPITGFLGLDHLYARSPKTAILKALVNMFTFGWWYLYDAFHVLLRPDQIKTFGFSAPIVGPIGVGAGQFSGDKKDQDKSSRFFIYSLLVTLVPFGIDYFYLGKNWMGFVKLLFTFVFFPIALLIGLWNIIKLFFLTGQTLDENYEFFGSVPSLKYQQYMAQQAGTTGGWFGWIYGWILGILQSDLLLAIPVIGPAIQLATASLNTATIAVEATGQTISIAKDTAAQVIKATGDTAKGVAAVASQAATIQQAFSPEGALQAIAESKTTIPSASAGKGYASIQTGGGRASSDIPTTILLSVLGLVVVSGGLSTLWRVIQNFRKPSDVLRNGSPESRGKKTHDRPPDAG
ncbi:MAG: TM2 domain-containing protein [Actinobacteria bacterium]|nr:TM2 domain-containing protein [Actinomycetota bacterium]